MCGIFGICESAAYKNGHKTPFLPLCKLNIQSGLISHRGPDMRNHYRNENNGNTLFHERLAINDLGCFHPIEGSGPDRQVVHNGEIYNHHALKETHFPHTTFRTSCDTEILIRLFDLFKGSEFCNLLDGTFALAICYDNIFFVARDPIGVKALYYGYDECGRFMCASEMKVINGLCKTVSTFPPGHYYTPETGLIRYYEPMWMEPDLKFNEVNYKLLNESLQQATIKRLMSDAPLGMLLSGGLDSSLICAIAVRELKRQGKPLKTYAVGLPGSPDLAAARKVADFLGTDHTEVSFTVEEGICALVKLIYHLESYDVTTVRAATPMYFLSRKIRNDGIKVVLSGEGSDEIFGGYLYFHNAPNDEDFHTETVRRVRLLSTADLLRADKSCMANSVEVRVPFLDKSFLETAMAILPADRRPTSEKIEKYVLRKAFDTPEDPYMPEEVLWRQKEQFSDGVGYSWIDSLVKYCTQLVSDYEMSMASKLYPHNTPKTKEAFYIRSVFHNFYPSDSAAKTVSPWIPKWQLSEDPSGRASKVHLQAKEA
uniref:Asparagine synthetase [glutamine-hydrolyzing] n=1 Tax=Bursaphelenchus xylophilus TaxID=6326 RepID=A0A1I7SSW8_BURXY